MVRKWRDISFKKKLCLTRWDQLKNGKVSPAYCDNVVVLSGKRNRNTIFCILPPLCSVLTSSKWTILQRIYYRIENHSIFRKDLFSSWFLFGPAMWRLVAIAITENLTLIFLGNIMFVFWSLSHLKFIIDRSISEKAL